MSQRRILKGDLELGDGPISQRKIDRYVETADGIIPQRTSSPPPSTKGREFRSAANDDNDD